MPAPRFLAAWAASALLVGLGACDGGTNAATTSTTATTAAAATSTTAGETASGVIAVVLGQDRLVVGGNALVYGAPRSQVRAYLDRALGAPTAIATQECGPGQLESFRWKGITAFVAEDGFGGWSADDPTFATERGIRVGSARAAVEASYPDATVEESTLGTEFFAPGPAEGTGLSGLYESGEVTDLWSGATCVAR